MARPRSDKPDKAEYDRRARAVQEWILKGYPTCDIIAQITAKWGVGERAAYNLHAKAWEIIQERNNRKLDAKLGFHTELRLKLFRELKEKNTPSGVRAALRIADSLAKIEGLLAKEIKSDGMDDFEDEEATATMKLPDGREIEL